MNVSRIVRANAAQAVHKRGAATLLAIISLASLSLTGCASSAITKEPSSTGPTVDCTETALKSLGYTVVSRRRNITVAQREVKQSFLRNLVNAGAGAEPVDQLTVVYSKDDPPSLLNIDEATVVVHLDLGLVKQNGLSVPDPTPAGTVVGERETSAEVKSDAKTVSARCGSRSGT